MMSLCHGWGWQPPQTASHLHIRHLQSIWAYWYNVYWHTVAALHSFAHSNRLRFGVLWVNSGCGVKMMSLIHVWGWQPPQTASPIYKRHLQSVWACWYAVHRHTVAALNSYTYPAWLRFWGSGSLMQSKWCHYIMVDADSHLKLLSTSILDISQCLSTLICCP